MEVKLKQLKSAPSNSDWAVANSDGSPCKERLNQKVEKAKRKNATNSFLGHHNEQTKKFNGPQSWAPLNGKRMLKIPQLSDQQIKKETRVGTMVCISQEKQQT